MTTASRAHRPWHRVVGLAAYTFLACGIRDDDVTRIRCEDSAHE